MHQSMNTTMRRATRRDGERKEDGGQTDLAIRKRHSSLSQAAAELENFRVNSSYLCGQLVWTWPGTGPLPRPNER